MNPETRYTNRFRRYVTSHNPTAVVVKHSDRFHHGIADLMIGIPTGACPRIFPIEVKYLPCVVTHRRKIPLKASQEDYLRNWSRIGSPACVLIGTQHGSALYFMAAYDGYIYGSQIQEDRSIWDRLLIH